MVDAQNVSLTFDTADGKVEALSKVSLQVAEGEFVSFIGPSGCGKTTMLRVIADLQQPTSGTLLVNGMSAEQARLARSYGYVFQSPALFPWRTIEKNLKLPLEVMGFSEHEQQQRAQDYLALVNLTGFERKFPWQLSGGMQQRASIARAFRRSGAAADGRAIRRARRADPNGYAERTGSHLAATSRHHRFRDPRHR